MNMIEITEEDIVLIEIFNESEEDVPNIKKALSKARESLKDREVDYPKIFNSLKSKGYICVNMAGERVIDVDTLYITEQGKLRVERIFKAVK